MRTVRTTITIEEALYREAKAAAARSGRSVSELIQDAVRMCLAAPAPDAGGVPPLPIYGGSGVLPGVDLADAGALRELMDEGSGRDALR